MNRKEAMKVAKRFLEDIYEVEQGLTDDSNALASLLLRTYKKGVKDALSKIESLDPLESTCCGEWDDVCDVAEGVQRWLLIQARNPVTPITKGRKRV